MRRNLEGRGHRFATGADGEIVGDYLSAEAVRRQGYFQAEAVASLVAEHMVGRAD